MAKIILLGALGDKFGGQHKINVRSVAEAVRALDANFKNFRNYLLDSESLIPAYEIVVGDWKIGSADEMSYPCARGETITFVPLLTGAKGKGLSIAQIFIGAGLMVLSAWAGGAAGAAYFGAAAGTVSSVSMAMGVSLALGGVSQLLAAHPKSTTQADLGKGSYYFNGPVNVSAQGAPVPVGYGRLVVGGTIISGGISSDPLPTSLTPYSGVTEILVPSPDLTSSETGNFGGFQILSGSGGGGGKGGGTANAASEDPNTLQSHAYASVVLAVCEGEIGGLANGAQSVYVNGTPLQNPDGSFNFAGVALFFSNGSQTQSVLPEVGKRIENEQAVGAQVFHAIPVIRTISDETITSVRVTIQTPQMTYQNPQTGDMHGTSVDIAIDLQSQGAGFQQVKADTISGKCTSPYERSYIIPLTGNPPWDLRVRRVSVDPTNINTQNLTYFKSFTEIIDTSLRYTNTAVCGIMIDSAQFQSIPTVSFDTYLIKCRVPSNYDPVTKTYNGIWDGTFKTAVTDNPAWCFYDIVTNERYGLGQQISTTEIDKWVFYTIGKYCDELVPDGFGGMRPRFTCNIYLQAQADAYKVLNDLASIFRGVAFWSGSEVTARQDSPEDPIYLFSPSNVVSRDENDNPIPPFKYQGASLKAMHTVVYVTWNDPLDQCKQKIEYVEDREAILKYGIIPTSIIAVGCKYRGEAHNAGKWLLYVEQHESEVLQFSTGVEGSGIGPGRIVSISDPTRAIQRTGGRVHASDLSHITLDSDFVPAGGSTIAAILPDGTFQEVNVVAQTGRTLSVVPDWRIAPNPSAPWAISQPTLVPQQFRVLSVTNSLMKNGTHAINALMHNPNKYAYIEDGAILEELPVINFAAAPLPVTNAKVSEYLYADGNKVKSVVVVSWTATGNATSYIISYTKDGGNWLDLPPQNSPSVDIRGLDKGAYQFKIRSRDLFGHYSNPVLIDYTVRGDSLPPADVTGFQVIEETGDLLLTWNPNLAVGLAGYELRQGDSWDTGAVLITQYSGTSFKVTPSEAGVYYFHIRAISTGGAYSENVTTISITLVAPATVTQFNVLQSNNTLVFSWFQNPESDIIGYEIREGANWSASMLVVQLLATHFSLPVNNAATRTFWIKAIKPPGIYSATAAFSTTDTVPLPNMNELVSSIQDPLWESHKIRCSVVSAELVQDANVERSEYIFAMSLGAQFNCINTIGLVLSAVIYDTVTWETADFTWDSVSAGRAWVPIGDTDSVSARVQIGRQTGLQSNEVDAWDLATTTSYNGVAATTAQYVTYQAGRYNNGIYVGDLTKVDWAASVPNIFSCAFWFQPDSLTDSIIWAVTNGSAYLRLGYSVSRGLFYLEDSAGHQITLAFSFAAGDYLLFGISQGTSTRTLHIGNLDCTVDSATGSFAPVGTFDKIQLHG